MIPFPFPTPQLVIMIVGAPTWFSVLWRIIRPLVNERTQKKVKICSKKGTCDCSQCEGEEKGTFFVIKKTQPSSISPPPIYSLL